MKNLKIRLSSLLLAVLITLGSLPLFTVYGTESSWSTDYRSWSQSDPLWGSLKIGTKTMSSVGCLVTAVAKLMVHAGQRDPAEFNPGICLAEMKSRDLFRGTNSMYTGLLATDYFSTYAPELTSVYNSGELDNPLSEKQAVDSIESFLENDYYVIVMTYTVRATTHWMAVDRIEDGKLMVMDNTGVIDLYAQSSYYGVSRYILVKYSGEYAYPASAGVLDGEKVNPDPDMLDRTEIYVAPDQLRVRSAPSLSASVLGGLNEGERVTVCETAEADGYVWGRLETGGWCAISLCDYVSGSLYYIFYDLCGGEGTIATQPNPFSQSVTLSDVVPTHESLNFLGWTTDPEGTMPVYFPGDTINVDADVTLYAIWAAPRSESYVVPDLLRVRSAPGLSSTKLTNLSEGTIITIYETVKADGYTWGRLENGGWCAISICAYVSGALNAIIYHANGGNGGVTYQESPTDQTVLLTDEIPTKNGCQFLGWTSDPESDVPDYQPGDAVTLEADLVLYALWSQPCDHEFTDSLVPPTATDAGYTLHTCQKCGYTYRSDVTDSLGNISLENGKLIFSAVLAEDGIDDTSDLTVTVDGKAVSPSLTDLTSSDGLTYLECTFLGLPLTAGQKITVTVGLAGHSFSQSFTPERDCIGYESSIAASYNTLCNLTLFTDERIPYQSTLTAVGDSGSTYLFTVSYTGGQRIVLTCEAFDASETGLYFEEKGFAVSVEGSDGNVNLLTGQGTAAFVPYYQTKKNDEDPACTDLRIIILGNMELLEPINSADLCITFYLGGVQVNQLIGTLGGQNSTYQLFRAVTAAGDIYVADTGYAIFGQQITGIPQGAYDRFTLKITNHDTGEILLDIG
ncbi:MAG: InlB B-repeat-containing protein [Eubacteriales bacterium]